MKIESKTVVIVGGGPAGLAAAVRLYEKGIRDILILEREKQLGGILRQCIHDGFGVTRLQKSLSGPEYAQLFIDRAEQLGIPYLTDVTVTGITPGRLVTVVSKKGLLQYQAQAVVLTMGCRERTRGALSIPGDRPAGVFTAGVAQSYINLHNTMVGREAVILGSGDIGMIMARRLTLEGAKVHAVFEVLPYPSGLPRNIEQCLNDYDIPLYLSHTVTNITGKSRLRAVTVSEVDDRKCPIPASEKVYPCDTLILSVGLIPENELSRQAGVALDARTRGAIVDEFYQTSTPGIFAAGNVLHVHDLVDYVSLEAEKLAEAVAASLHGPLPPCRIALSPGAGVGYVVPHKISGQRDAHLSFRVRAPLSHYTVSVWQDGACLLRESRRKAIPAEMETVLLPKERIHSQNPVEVVADCD